MLEITNIFDTSPHITRGGKGSLLLRIGKTNHPTLLPVTSQANLNLNPNLYSDPLTSNNMFDYNSTGVNIDDLQAHLYNIPAQPTLLARPTLPAQPILPATNKLSTVLVYRTLLIYLVTNIRL